MQLVQLEVARMSEVRLTIHIIYGKHPREAAAEVEGVEVVRQLLPSALLWEPRLGAQSQHSSLNHKSVIVNKKDTDK